jgi:hypothetical protein
MKFRNNLDTFIIKSKVFQSIFTGRGCRTMQCSNAKLNYNQLERAYRKGGYTREEWVNACKVWGKSENELVKKMSEVILTWMASDDKYGKSQYR